MANFLRYANAADKLRKGWEHVTVGTDLILTSDAAIGSSVGDYFFRLDTGTFTDPDTDETIDPKANQKLFIDGRYEWQDIDMNWHGTDMMSLSGANSPMIVTNIGGKVIFRQIAMNGIKHVKFTGKFVDGESGWSEYPGHNGANNRLGQKGVYGFENRNTNYSGQGLVFLLDRYGDQAYGCSDIEVEYCEFLGGVTSIQFKNDFLNDDGYFDHPSFPLEEGQTYSDYPTNTVKASGTMWNMKIHDCYFHDCRRGEPVYSGHTGADSTLQHSIHIRVYNNIFTRAGREAIQLSRCIPNMTAYATSSDDAVSEWKSGFFNNTILISGAGWLTENPNGAANNQDVGVSLGCRNGGIRCDNNIIIGGAEFTMLVQQDLGGGLTTGNYAQIADSEDEDTWVQIKNNYISGMRGNFNIYCQSSLSTSDRYLLIEDNYFADTPFDWDSFYTATEPTYYISGNDDDTYITLRDNIKQDSGRTLAGSSPGNSFSPTSSRVTETGTTTNGSMDVPTFIDSGWDDANKEWLRYYHWTDEVGATGGGTQSGVFYSILEDDVVVVENQKFYRAKSAHNSNTANSEPGVGSSWETYWTELGEGYFNDDLRLSDGDTYKALGMGVDSSYYNTVTTNSTHNGLALTNLVV